MRQDNGDGTCPKVIFEFGELWPHPLRTPDGCLFRQVRPGR
jgi:hypothetical protein